MWKLVVLLLVVVTVTEAYPQPYWGFPYGYHGYPYNYWGFPYGHGGYAAPVPSGKYVYYGEFPGSCLDKPDGLYYVDERSFAYCFSGQKSVQPCAEGSANPPLGYFSHGGQYGTYDFCSINLVAQGYGYGVPKAGYYNGKKSAVPVKSAGYGYGKSEANYIEPQKEAY